MAWTALWPTSHNLSGVRCPGDQSFSESMTAGYSGTPLAKKLGIKPGMQMYVVAAPANYSALVAPLPEDVKMVAR